MLMETDSKEKTMVALMPTLCARCAMRGRTCCQGREIYLTPGDLRRIRTFTGEDQFVEWTRCTDPAYLDQNDDPVWRMHVFSKDGSRRTLRRTLNGDCVFLGAAGCRLPLDVRPLLCRLHPITYTADHIDSEPDAGCPRHLLTIGESILTAIHMPMDVVSLWHHQLYEEILTDDHDNRIDL